MTTGSPLWSSRDLVKSSLEMQHTCNSQAVFIRECSQKAGVSQLGWSKMELYPSKGELSAGSVDYS